MKIHFCRYVKNRLPVYFTRCAGMNNTHASTENQMCRYIKYGWPVPKQHVGRYRKPGVPVWLAYRQPAYSCLDRRYIFYSYLDRRYIFIFCTGRRINNSVFLGRRYKSYLSVMPVQYCIGDRYTNHTGCWYGFFMMPVKWTPADTAKRGRRGCR